MKKLLASAITLLLGAGTLSAQVAVPTPMAEIPQQDIATTSRISDGPTPLFNASSVEQRYDWVSRHFYRPNDQQQDSNVFNFAVPWQIPSAGGGTLELRGCGEMFSPSVIHEFWKPIYTTGLGASMAYDSAQYQQFIGARAFDIDTIVTSYFQNPYSGDPTFAGKFFVWATPASVDINALLRGGQYRQSGLLIRRGELVEKFATTLDLPGHDTTIDGNNIHPVTYAFDPPLSFDFGQAAIAMFYNDEAVALENPRVDPSDTRDFQVVRSYLTSVPGGQPVNGLWRSQGMVGYRSGGSTSTPNDDSVETIWSTLVFSPDPPAPSRPAAMDAFFAFRGTVDLVTGVKYHFGTDASSQGISKIVPNPARETSRITFALGETSSVVVELYAPDGSLVRRLVDSRYIKGVYSYDLDVTGLSSGTYMIRMAAGTNNYSAKLNVVK